MSPEPSLGRVRTPRWRVERALVDQLADPLLEHDTAMIAISSAFNADGCAERLAEWLDDAARALFPLTTDDLRGRAVALASLMTNQLGLRACVDCWEGLLLDGAIATRCGHPLLLAGLGRELARRAGWSSLIGHGAECYCTVLTAGGSLIPIAYDADPAALDPARLRACCPHEAVNATLTAISRHAPVDLAASAERVRGALPAEPRH
jgi:hypothetical protein